MKRPGRGLWPAASKAMERKQGWETGVTLQRSKNITEKNAATGSYLEYLLSFETASNIEQSYKNITKIKWLTWSLIILILQSVFPTNKNIFYIIIIQIWKLGNLQCMNHALLVLPFLFCCLQSIIPWLPWLACFWRSQYSVRMFLCLGLSNDSSVFNSSSLYFARIPQEWCCVLFGTSYLGLSLPMPLTHQESIIQQGNWHVLPMIRNEVSYSVLSV